jgi:hypothetical protein
MDSASKSLWNAAPLPSSPSLPVAAGREGPTLSYLEPDAVCGCMYSHSHLQHLTPSVSSSSGFAALAHPVRSSGHCERMRRIPVFKHDPPGTSCHQKSECCNTLARRVFCHGWSAPYPLVTLRPRSLIAHSQNEELDFAAALSALQWATATVACTRTGYPKVFNQLNPLP